MRVRQPFDFAQGRESFDLAQDREPVERPAERQMGVFRQPQDRPGPTGYFRWIRHTLHLQGECLLLEGLSQKGNSRPSPQQQLLHALILIVAHGRPA